jgi:FAD:protein FMN transferase
MTSGSTIFRAMGCEVIVAGADRSSLAAIRRLFAARDARFSRFRPDSELCSVNRAAGRPTRVSRPFAEAVSCALGMAVQTGGLVDPTVGGSLAALGYGRDFAELGDDLSPAGPVAAAVGWHRVILTGLVLRIPAGCALDLNGVVKAAAVDEAVGLLTGDGFVSAGGDLAVRGPQDVALPGDDAVRVIHGGVATSGTSRRRWRRGGVWYHHLIDPATGLPAESPWREVTASGETCLAADVAARAALLAGDDGPDWLDQRGIPGRLVAVDGRVRINDAWAAMTEAGLCT